MLRRLVILVLPLMCLMFTACGGSDQDEAPPTALTGPEHPDDMASRIDLQNKMRMAKSSCVQAYGPAVQAAAPIIFSNPGTSPGMLLQPGGPVSAALSQTAPMQEQCSNALEMAYRNAKTMMNGQYWGRPDVQNWIRGNMAFMGDSMMAGMPPQALANPGFISGMREFGKAALTQVALPRVNDPGMRFQVNQQFAALGY